MTNSKLEYLFDRYVNNLTNADEEKEFMELVSLPENKDSLLNLLQHFIGKTEATSKPSAEAEEAILEAIFQARPAAKVVPIKRAFHWWRWVAAAIILVLSAGLYFLFSSRPNKNQEIVKTAPQDLEPPKGTKATIMLANGRKVLLDSIASGTLATQGNVNIIKNSDGQIIYNGASSEVVYNTLYNPRGSKVVSLALADGTRVWLNAESSLTYPVTMIGKERRVEITGEAYFEVTKNVNMPFKVKAASSEVEVLGTHFNVNAYNDEATIKTTLLEGLVKVSSNNQSPKFLNPGQQSQITKDGKINVIANADTEEAVAWVNGRFQYKSADIKTIMRQISHWYDVDVQYKGNVNIHFTGQLLRDQNVSGIFKKLALTGDVKFTIDGKKIIVSPN